MWTWNCINLDVSPSIRQLTYYDRMCIALSQHHILPNSQSCLNMLFYSLSDVVGDWLIDWLIDWLSTVLRLWNHHYTRLLGEILLTVEYWQIKTHKSHTTYIYTMALITEKISTIYCWKNATAWIGCSHFFKTSSLFC